jgi:hypothetical protein
LSGVELAPRRERQPAHRFEKVQERFGPRLVHLPRNQAWWNMQSADYYRKQAVKAERLAFFLGDAQAKAELEKMAGDYRDIAIDLEDGAVEVRHPARMPQLKDGGQAEPDGPPGR